MVVLKATKRLNGTNIWLDGDYTIEVLEERKLLTPPLKKARQKGKRAQLKFNKLFVDGLLFEIISTSRKCRRSRQQQQRQPMNIKGKEPSFNVPRGKV